MRSLCCFVSPIFSTCDIQSATSTFIDNIPLTTSTSRGDIGAFNHHLAVSASNNNSSSITYHSNHPNTNNAEDNYADHSDADLIGEECRPGPINTLLDARSQALYAVLQDHTYAIQPHPSVPAPEAQSPATTTQQPQQVQKQQQQLRSIPSTVQRHEITPAVRTISEHTGVQNQTPVGSSQVLSTSSGGGSGVSQLMYTTSVSGSSNLPQQHQLPQPHSTLFQTMVAAASTATTVDGSVIVQKSLPGGGFNLAYHKQPAGEFYFCEFSYN